MNELKWLVACVASEKGKRLLFPHWHEEQKSKCLLNLELKLQRLITCDKILTNGWPKWSYHKFAWVEEATIDASLLKEEGHERIIDKEREEIQTLQRLWSRHLWGKDFSNTLSLTKKNRLDEILKIKK